MLVSARPRPLRSIDQLRAAVRSGRPFRSPVELLAHGLFGMNVGGVPLTDSTHGFGVIAGALLVLTGMLAYLAFGRRDDWGGRFDGGCNERDPAHFRLLRLETGYGLPRTLLW